ncbi:hypothetical protein IFM89_001669 [Coptis chinensis]|uniref:NAC domain-containing protein n=1 Tax=Coptis chinensis TaxID=261450 RepID=A0A835LL82_9MAGN|nr:hypothetical protein IFM89_001669 [Coptis chinensis]
MTGTTLPPGFRFHPTDVELVLYYLKRKVLGKSHRFQAIVELDLYKFAPWDLPEKSCLRSGDLEWYFFCPRDRKYNNGPRTNRATGIGYWKTTGRDRTICNGPDTVGMKKTLIFHLGRAPRGDRTNWVMHEYRLEVKQLFDTGVSQDSFVLCKIFEKSGAGPKNGEQRGAPFKEEEWEDDLIDNSLAPLALNESGSPSSVLDTEKNAVIEDSALIPGETCESLEPPCKNASNDASGKPPFVLEDDDMDSLLAILGDENDMSQTINNNNEIPWLLNQENNVEAPPPDGCDIFGSLGDLGVRAEPSTVVAFSPTDVKDKYILGQTLLGDDEVYLELNDFNGPMKYPIHGDGPKHIQYDNFSSRLELESGLQNSPFPRENLFAIGLNDLEIPAKYPVELNYSENIPSSNQFGYRDFDSVKGFSFPYASSNAIFPGFGDGSSSSKLHGVSGVFENRSGVPPNYFQGNGFGGTTVCGNEDANKTPKMLSGGNVERINTYGPQSSARAEGLTGEQHRVNSRVLCLLGSIPARPALAAEHPSPMNAGKGSKGSSLFPNIDGSSIRVKAEVTVRCGCTEEALSGNLGEFLYLCCYGCKYPRQELQKEPAVCGSSGLTFIFLLGVVTPLMWVFFFSMVVRLG